MKTINLKQSIATAVLILLTTLMNPIHSKGLGINVNGQFDEINFNDLARTNTKWVRGFVDFNKYYNNPSLLKTDPKIKNYLQLKSKGYKTILNIKWNYSSKSFPAANSQEMTKIKNFLTELYDVVWAKTDIIVVGNEPFIESKKNERNNKLVTFYKNMAKATNAYKNNNNRKIPIYVGSINNLWQKSAQTKATKDLLAFAKNSSFIAGVDLHIHHNAMSDIDGAMRFVNSRIRDNQKIIITEYSLMKYFKSKLNLNITPSFASKYGYSANLKVYQYIDKCLKNSVTRPEWVDFFKMNGWYKSKERYVRDSYNKFKSYEKFHIATYALRQSYPFNKDFTANTDPWVLNGIYVNRTVVPNPSNGQTQFNYKFIDDFKLNIAKSAKLENAVAEEKNTHEIELVSTVISSEIEILNYNAGDKYYLVDMSGHLINTFSQPSFSIGTLNTGLYLLLNSNNGASSKVLITR